MVGKISIIAQSADVSLDLVEENRPNWNRFGLQATALRRLQGCMHGKAGFRWKTYGAALATVEAVDCDRAAKFPLRWPKAESATASSC